MRTTRQQRRKQSSPKKIKLLLAALIIFGGSTPLLIKAFSSKPEAAETLEVAENTVSQPATYTDEEAYAEQVNTDFNDSSEYEEDVEILDDYPVQANKTDEEFAWELANYHAETTHYSKERVFDQISYVDGDNIDESLARSILDSLDYDWSINALETIDIYATTFPELTSDDIYEILVDPVQEKFTPDEATYAIFVYFSEYY